jgi:hypothetical protein
MSKDTPNPDQKPEVVEQEVAQPVDHPIWKLALNVMLTPKDAFEEIRRRKLVGAGLVITALLGLVYFGATLFAHYAGGGVSLFGLGVGNPVMAVGTVLLTAMLLQWLLVKFSRAEGTFIDTLLVVAWSEIAVGVVFLIGLIPLQPLMMLTGAAPIVGIILASVGLKHTHKINGLNAGATYVLSLFVTGIPGFAYTVVTDRVQRAFMSVRYHDIPVNTPTLSSEIGLLIGSVWISSLALIAAAALWPKIAEGVSERFRTLLAGLAVIAVIGSGIFTVEALTLDPLRYVNDGMRIYNDEATPDPALAVRKFNGELGYYPLDDYVRLCRAHALAASGNYADAEKDYKKFDKSAPQIVDTSIATIRLMQGNYKAAADDLAKVVKTEPTYGEAQARLALADLFVGKDKEATDAANASIKTKYKGYLPYLALAQAYTASGDKKKADEAVQMISELNPELAKRIEKAPGGWSDAAHALTRIDLRMPLELPSIVHEPQGKGKKK